MIVFKYCPFHRWDKLQLIKLPSYEAFFRFFQKHHDKGCIYDVKEGPGLINITTHGKKRIKKRCGVNMKSAQRIANIAFENGLSRFDISGCFRKYIDHLYFSYGKQANNIRVYGDKVYIFCERVLVTVLDLPHRYRKTANNQMIKRRISNAD